jgi:tetratricopeptide (TPR) repeat protein
LFFSNLYAAGTDSGDSAKTNYGKDYKSAIKLIRSKDYDKAIRKLKTLTTASSTDFTRADVYNELGFAYRKSDDFDNAAKYYKKALELDPEHLGAIEYQGEMYVDLGQKDNALSNLELLKTLVGEKNSYYKELNNYISNN